MDRDGHTQLILKGSVMNRLLLEPASLSNGSLSNGQIWEIWLLTSIFDPYWKGIAVTDLWEQLIKSVLEELGGITKPNIQLSQNFSLISPPYFDPQMVPCSLRQCQIKEFNILRLTIAEYQEVTESISNVFMWKFCCEQLFLVSFVSQNISFIS